MWTRTLDCTSTVYTPLVSVSSQSHHTPRKFNFITAEKRARALLEVRNIKELYTPPTYTRLYFRPRLDPGVQKYYL